MIENFSWKDNPKENFRDYVRSLQDDDIEGILSGIPSAWNEPPKSHREFAKWLIEKLNPEVIVELGVDYGYSAFVMSLYSKGKVYGIDCFAVIKNVYRKTDDYKFVLDIKEKLKLDNLEIIKGYFDEVVKTWDKPIDILHIDGLHKYKECKNDYEKWSPFVKDDGVILFHDTISYSDQVGVAFSEVDLPKLTFTNSNGLGVASKNASLIEDIRKTFPSITK